jgi:hypothetical protein
MGMCSAGLAVDREIKGEEKKIAKQHRINK